MSAVFISSFYKTCLVGQLVRLPCWFSAQVLLNWAMKQRKNCMRWSIWARSRLRLQTYVWLTCMESHSLMIHMWSCSRPTVFTWSVLQWTSVWEWKVLHWKSWSTGARNCTRSSYNTVVSLLHYCCIADCLHLDLQVKELLIMDFS